MSKPRVLLIKGLNNELEAEIFQSQEDKKQITILCHPHPQYGGNMHNNVITSIFEILSLNELSCFRFNFRGVGKSTGSNSGGKGEISDVRNCVDYLIKNSYEEIIICGYSYGAAIGGCVINYNDKIIGYCAISFPWDFMGKKYKKLTQTTKPKLFIQGTQDNLANVQNFESHYNFYLEPKSKIFIEGADHFYSGFESLVSIEVLKFIKTQFGFTT